MLLLDCFPGDTHSNSVGAVLLGRNECRTLDHWWRLPKPLVQRSASRHFYLAAGTGGPRGQPTHLASHTSQPQSWTVLTSNMATSMTTLRVIKVPLPDNAVD